ncbi:uncharacterized protein RB166_000354 [Leptodactylus fuscus]|uniref:uncharacterized protein LOC142195385 n=1 Tax=Leptodactylus fuscus TaxID=238119 RepID=UPI003F4E8729
MYYSVLIAWLIGVIFTSSGASITANNGLMPELKLNVSRNIDKNATDEHAITYMEASMDSIIHGTHKTGSSEQAEDSKMKPDVLSLESILNRFNAHIDNNKPSPLQGKDTSKNKDESVIVAFKRQEQPQIEIKSNDEQSQGFSSDGVLEQYGTSPLSLNTENVIPVAEHNSEYANVLEELYDDEDLQYILNITHNLDTVRQNVNNETHSEVYVEELSSEDATNIKDLKNATNNKEEDMEESAVDAQYSGDYSKIIKDRLMKEENGLKTRVRFGDLLVEQKGSNRAEQQNQQSDSIIDNNMRGDVTNVDHSTELTNIDQNNTNTELSTTALPRFLENISGLHVNLHNHDVASSQEEKGSLVINTINISADPCINFHCKRGTTCKKDENENPFCTCQDPNSCLPGNRNDFVCGTDNKTYTSTCHLFATKCHLEGTKEGNHLHLDYQGSCKYISPCTEYELTHFPFRMRDWLKNVLMQLYERDQGNTGLLSEKQKHKVKKIYENEKRLQEGDHNIEILVKDFQKNYHMYIYPVHWQFHQLDQHSMDRLLTHSELAALRVPLIPNEHCVNAFLQECNTNNDRHISLREWCHCFGIKEDDINEDLLF